MRGFAFMARRRGPNGRREARAMFGETPASDPPALTSDPHARVGFTSLFVAGSDGLKLHVRCYGAPVEGRAPVVCLPGFARSGADYHCVALALAHDATAPRRVLVLDYRGHGRSDFERDAGRYGLESDFADLSAVLTALEIPCAVFAGTCHGGLLTMMLAGRS